jgi:hypothetical protein
MFLRMRNLGEDRESDNTVLSLEEVNTLVDQKL